MVSPREPEESKDRDSDLTDVPAALYLGPGLDPPAGGMRMGHVLLVDDDEMNRTMISRLIQPLCVRLLAASDGSEAVWLMRRAQENQDYFDLVLLDYQMPNMDGPTTAQVLREMGYRGLIVGMTSRTRQDKAGGGGRLHCTGGEFRSVKTVTTGETRRRVVSIRSTKGIPTVK